MPSLDRGGRPPGDRSAGAEKEGAGAWPGCGGRSVSMAVRTVGRALRRGPHGVSLYDGAMPPDPRPYDALLLVSFGGPESPTTSSRSWRTSPAAAASRASGSRRWASTTSCSAAGRRSTTRTGRCSPRSARTSPRRPRPAGLLGQPQLGPLPHRHVRRRCATTGSPGRLLRDAAPTRRTPAAGSTARTSPPPPPRSRARRSSTSCGLLQPPGLRRAVVDATVPRSRSCPTSPRGAHLVFVTHSIPTAMNERSGPAAAPTSPSTATSPPRSPSGCGGTGRGPVATWSSVALRAAAGAVAGARRQRPPRELAEGGRPASWCRADRLRLRPHGGRLRPRHRGAGDGRAARCCPSPGPRRRAPTRASSRWSATCCSSGRRPSGASRSRGSPSAACGRAGTCARPAAAPTRAAPPGACGRRPDPGAAARDRDELLVTWRSRGAGGRRADPRRVGPAGVEVADTKSSDSTRHRGRPGQRGADPARLLGPAPTTGSSARRATTSSAPRACAGSSTRSTAP